MHILHILKYYAFCAIQSPGTFPAKHSTVVTVVAVTVLAQYSAAGASSGVGGPATAARPNQHPQQHNTTHPATAAVTTAASPNNSWS